MIKMRFWNQLCVKSVIDLICTEKGYNDNLNFLFKSIYERTKGNKKGLEVFDLPEGVSIEQKLNGDVYLKKYPELVEKVEHLEKMFADPLFRKEIYDLYAKDILPNLQKNYSFVDFWKICTKPHPVQNSKPGILDPYLEYIFTRK